MERRELCVNLCICIFIVILFKIGSDYVGIFRALIEFLVEKYE